MGTASYASGTLHFVFACSDVATADIAEYRLKWGTASCTYTSTVVFAAGQRAASLRDIFPSAGTYYAALTASTQEGATPVETTTEETITVTGRLSLVR